MLACSRSPTTTGDIFLLNSRGVSVAFRDLGERKVVHRCLCVFARRDQGMFLHFIRRVPKVRGSSCITRFLLLFLSCVNVRVLSLRGKTSKAECVVLLENVRFHKGETKNDPAFAEKVRGWFPYTRVKAAHECSVLKVRNLLAIKTGVSGFQVPRQNTFRKSLGCWAMNSSNHRNPVLKGLDPRKAEREHRRVTANNNFPDKKKVRLYLLSMGSKTAALEQPNNTDVFKSSAAIELSRIGVSPPLVFSTLSHSVLFVIVSGVLFDMLGGPLHSCVA